MTDFVSMPTKFNNANVSEDEFYFGSATDNAPDAATRVLLWHNFIEVALGDIAKQSFYLTPNGTGGFTQQSLYSIMRTGNTWPPAALSTYKDDKFIEGMFASTLKSFFYDYKSSGGNVGTDSTSIANNYRTYLQSPNIDNVAKKQNTILLWVWEVLLKVLANIHNATPSKGGYLLAMTSAEDKAAQKIEDITYAVQASANDYSTQAANMNKQKDAEVARSQRASAGKNGQTAQSMMTQLRDQATQQAQLMSTLMQTMESLYQAIIKK